MMETRSQQNQAGFTMLELVIAVTLLGLVSMSMAPVFSMFLTAKTQAYQENQAAINVRLSNGYLAYAREASALGQLPAPYTKAADKLYTAPYNPADLLPTAVGPYLVQTRVSNQEINDDNTSAQRVRVYQRLAGLTQDVPLYFQSGPAVRLTYDFGALYMTTCPRANTSPSCNFSASLGIPGVSPVLTASNFLTWKTVDPDQPAVVFSTLQIQKDMLRLTAVRLDKVRDGFAAYFRAKVISASASDSTNWYPAPSLGTPNLATISPLTNQGCRDGWYDLSTTDILNQIGLTASELGKTAWGGTVEYCRDYDPAGTSGANAPPHFAALRVNRNVSAALAPDLVTPLLSNVVLSF
jgi:prepilin-type N-terminal cleavage/methylation domain-containing protein